VNIYTDPTFVQISKDALDSLGVKDFILDGRLSEWEIVIKAHVIIEAALSDLISKRLNLNGGCDFVDKMQISSKVKLSVELDLIGNNFQSYINTISFIRNHCAHKISGIKFSISEHLDSVTDHSKKDKMVKSLLQFHNEKLWTERYLIENFREVMGFSLNHVLLMLYLSSQICDKMNERNVYFSARKYNSE
jgi:hypothetical protein